MILKVAETDVLGGTKDKMLVLDTIQYLSVWYGTYHTTYYGIKCMGFWSVFGCCLKMPQKMQMWPVLAQFFWRSQHWF